MEVSLSVNNLKRTRELNGINSLEFETDKKIEKGNRLVFKDYQGIWNEYIVQEVEILHEGLKIEYSVFCEQSINELFGHFISDLKPRETKATAIVDKVLQDTRFSVGHIDDLGLRSFNLYHIDAKSALWKIIDIYDCDIDVNIDVKDSKVVGRYINLYKHKGSFEGKRYTYKKDIKSIKKTIDYTNIATKLYGYGKGEEIVDEDGKPTGGYGRKINFSEINNGKQYITNEEARLKYGVGKEKRHIEGIFEDGDCEDKKGLLELTKKELEKRSKPKISYELKVEDLSKYPGFEFEGVGLGDDVIVKDNELDLTVYTRIIKIIDSPSDNSDTEITLGNYIKDISNKFLEYENLRKSIESRNKSIGEEIDKLAKSTEQGFLKSLVDRLNTELNATGGYVYFEQGKGIIILNAPKEGNPTQAITLKGGTIAIANKKKANGDWDWTTFGTGNGFTASVLTAGILRGGKVRWNLEDGTFIIGKSSNDYSMFWDGGTLHLRNTDIDLSNNVDIEDMKKSISLKVSRGDIISEINQSPEQVKIKASKIDLEGSSVNIKGTLQTLNSTDDIGIKIDYNQIHFQDNRRDGFRFGIINVNKLWYKERAFSLNLGHYQEGFLSISWYRDGYKEWEPYMVFDRWGKSTYATEGYSIRVLDTINFDKTALFKGNVVINNSTTFNDECKFERNITFGGNRIKIVNYSDGLGFVNGNGEGLFIEGSGAVYLMDTQYKYRVAKE